MLKCGSESDNEEESGGGQRLWSLLQKCAEPQFYPFAMLFIGISDA